MNLPEPIDPKMFLEAFRGQADPRPLSDYFQIAEALLGPIAGPALIEALKESEQP